MAKETRSWEANDGSLHKTECDAARRDLQLLIADSPCAENSPYAKIMLDWMTRNPREIAKTLIEYADACPENLNEEAPLPATPGPMIPEGTREPADETHGAMSDVKILLEGGTLDNG